jgi:hypothetical protein
MTMQDACNDVANAEIEHLRAINAEMLAVLKQIARCIDDESGSPHFTAKEHDFLLKVIAKAEGNER